MSALNWFPFHYKDFMTSQRVAVMTKPQRAAYVWLLCHAWSDQDCGVPASSKKLKEWAQWEAKDGDFRKVRACFKKHPTVGGKLYNPRLYEEWVKAKQKQESARASVQARWSRPAVQQPISKKVHDRGKGFMKVGSEIQAVADKHFPPI